MSIDMTVFAKNYLVSGLDDEAMQLVANLSTYEMHTVGDQLIRKGEPDGDLFVILEGRAHVLGPNGETLAEVGPGGVLGEMGLVDALPRSANVICPGVCKVARFPAKELRSFMNNYRQIGFVMLANLTRVLSSRLRKADSTILDLMQNPVDPWDKAL